MKYKEFIDYLVLFLKHFNNVNDMSGMFRSSKATVLDLSDLDTSNVTNISDIFRNSKATTLDLSYLDTSNATNRYDKLGEEEQKD